jgi:leucyl/phenylalanyl-tRNA--protein transferase
MAIRWLTPALEFPPPESADDEGVVAVGGDCSVERLLLAYRSGIFPWPMAKNLPLFWFSPDPRYVIPLARVHLPRSLRKEVRRGTFEVRVDTDFDGVIRGCAASPRPGQRGTWITPTLRQGFLNLHREGFAHSIEAWRDGRLVGGLYGLSLGGAFFGESMFAAEPDASKVAFTVLLGHLAHWGFDFVDCQTRTDHLERFGAIPVARESFLDTLRTALAQPTRMGPWRFELPPAEALAKLSG